MVRSVNSKFPLPFAFFIVLLVLLSFPSFLLDIQFANRIDRRFVLLYFASPAISQPSSPIQAIDLLLPSQAVHTARAEEQMNREL